MYEDFVSDTWYYQRILSKGEKKGFEKGVEQGMRTILLDIIQQRFPTLLPLAQERLPQFQDHELLRRLTTNLVQAQSTEEAELYLRTILKDAS